MRIIIYSKVIRKVSGVQTFELAFLQEFSKWAKITIVYDVGDESKLREFAKYADIVKNQRQEIECDICIFSSIAHENHRIKANRYIQVCHMDFYAWRVRYHPKPEVEHVAVSETVRESLKVNYGLESTVISNLLPKMDIKKVLRLMTATRIDQGKGIERVIQLIEKLKANGRPFIYQIFGEGTTTYTNMIKDKVKNIPEVHFVGGKNDIQSYILGNHYLVQLSDSEGFCYSVHESLQAGVPVIVTNWTGVEETVHDGVNGHILNMDLSNLDVNKLYDQYPSKISYDVKNIRQNWIDLLS